MRQTTAVWSHHTMLAAEAVSASKARDFVCQQLLAQGLGYLAEDVRLVVSELATNAMVHAQTPFSVRIEGDEQRVVLTVRDGSSTAPVRVTAQVLDTSGRGLSIVDLVSQDWGVITDADLTKSVWAAFDVRVAAGAQPGW